MIYVNFDLETTGGKPDQNAILSIGAVADAKVNGMWHRLGEFTRNLTVPSNRGWDSDTVRWWTTVPDAFMKTREAPQFLPEYAIPDMLTWLRQLQRDPPTLVTRPVDGGPCSPEGLGDRRIAFVANPIAFDLPMLRSYFEEYCGITWLAFSTENRAGLGGLDLPTLAMAALKVDYTDARRSQWPERWNDPTLPHTHVALDDAKLQAHAFMRVMDELGF